MVWPVPPRFWDALDDPSPPSEGPWVNTGQPPIADLREHYRQFLSTHLLLDVAMCWTVVVPDSRQAFSLNQLAVRLSGDAPNQLHEPALPDALGLPYDTNYPVFVDRCGSAVMLVEGDYLGSMPSVLGPPLPNMSPAAR